MLIKGITKAGLSKSSFPMWGLWLESKDKLRFSVQSGYWIHSRCVGVKNVAPIV